MTSRQVNCYFTDVDRIEHPAIRPPETQFRSSNTPGGSLSISDLLAITERIEVSPVMSILVITGNYYNLHPANFRQRTRSC